VSQEEHFRASGIVRSFESEPEMIESACTAKASLEFGATIQRGQIIFCQNRRVAPATITFSARLRRAEFENAPQVPPKPARFHFVN
jgi:hypothetical protein